MKIRTSCRLLLLVALAAPLRADVGTCSSAFDMDAAVKSALDSAATSIFQQAQRGDYFGLRSASIPSLAAGFGSVEAAIGENRANFQNAQAAVRSEFQLNAPASAGGRTEFLCGAYPDLVGFAINNLPPGQYGIVILDVKGGKTPFALSVILHNAGAWKLAGFYLRPVELAGHDGNWYFARANDFKARNQNYNAYFYYVQAWELLAPLNFMSTPQLDRVGDASLSVRPADIPINGRTADLAAAAKTYRLTEMFPTAADGDFELVVRYQAASVADRAAAERENAAVIRALVAKHPELREGFAGVVARAVTSAGDEYGSRLPMKDMP